MKRFKNVGILLGVLAVLIAVTTIVKKTEEKKEEIRTSEDLILAVDPDSVDALSWQYEDTALSFHKDGEWHWDEDEAFPVNELKMQKLLDVFRNFTSSFTIENAEDLGQYGLDDPVCTIRLSAGGNSWQVDLGAFSTMDAQRYVSTGDGKVYLVSRDPFGTYEVGIRDMIQNDELPYYDHVEKLSFAGTENYEAAYDEESTASCCDSDVYFVKQGEEELPLDTGKVEDYTTNLRLLELNNYESYNVTDEELSTWGLDTPELSVTVDYTSPQKDESGSVTDTPGTVTIHLGRNREELAEREKAEAERTAADGAQTDDDGLPSVASYVRVGDSKIVYRITDPEYETLAAASVNDLRHSEVLTADDYKITQIVVSLEGSTYVFDSRIRKDAETEEEERVFSYGGKEIDIEGLKGKAAGLSVNSFTEEVPEGKLEISMSFLLSDANHPQVIVDLYRYDGSDCLAVVNGRTLGLVDRSDAVALIEAVNSIVL